MGRRTGRPMAGDRGHHLGEGGDRRQVAVDDAERLAVRPADTDLDDHAGAGPSLRRPDDAGSALIGSPPSGSSK